MYFAPQRILNALFKPGEYNEMKLKRGFEIKF